MPGRRAVNGLEIPFQPTDPKKKTKTKTTTTKKKTKKTKTKKPKVDFIA